eukprot:scaffold14068_cov119-Isochrysis_galbana.AAC.21
MLPSGRWAGRLHSNCPRLLSSHLHALSSVRLLRQLPRQPPARRLWASKLRRAAQPCARRPSAPCAPS